MPNPTSSKPPVATSKSTKPLLRCMHVTLENKPGMLAKAARALADAGVNVEAVESEILGRSGFFRCYTDQPELAEKTLRAKGYVVVAMEILEVRLENRPGEAARMCETLSAAKVNIESMFGSSPGKGNGGLFYLRVDKPAEALRELVAARFDATRHA
ncbi:MAG TPA: ACT domain-containing protein [Candidatus Thermoplasmatota archaeon]|nr:ACT domain-containing protein [Candidatus Thermoplasmatota archaeon]